MSSLWSCKSWPLSPTHNKPKRDTMTINQVRGLSFVKLFWLCKRISKQRSLIQLMIGWTVLNNQYQHQEVDDEGSKENRDHPFAHNWHHRNRHREEERKDRRWESGFKWEIPKFHGRACGEELLDCLVAVNELLEFKQVPAEKQVALVVTKFHGGAGTWWLQLKATRARTGKEKITSWKKLQKCLHQSFLPQNYDRTMYTRLQNLRQGFHSVDEYTDEFYLLITLNEIFDNEIQLVTHLLVVYD